MSFNSNSQQQAAAAKLGGFTSATSTFQRTPPRCHDRLPIVGPAFGQFRSPQEPPFPPPPTCCYTLRPAEEGRAAAAQRAASVARGGASALPRGGGAAGGPREGG
eukprot:8479811-Alexandrium_andersonii.AAC.1